MGCKVGPVIVIWGSVPRRPVLQDVLVSGKFAGVSFGNVPGWVPYWWLGGSLRTVPGRLRGRSPSNFCFQTYES